uniref:C2H2-type domain-containing protein n=1 Tax=Strongyloides venezuelensis TaxID=75913 RepID=A0A0K0F5M5_STRVS
MSSPKIELIVVDDDEISLSDSGSDIEILYAGPPIRSPEFIMPNLPGDLTAVNNIQSSNSNDLTLGNDDIVGGEVNELNSSQSFNLENPTTHEVSNFMELCSTGDNDDEIVNNSQGERHVESHPCTANENSPPSCNVPDGTLTEQNINMEELQKGNSEIVNKDSTTDKNNGYPPHVIRCENGCNNCRRIRCPKVKSYATNRDDNWSYNVRLPLLYIYHSDYLTSAIKSGNIDCYCNLCKTDVGETGTDLINHVINGHLHFKRHMFRCSLCRNIRTNDIFVIQKHWKDKHSEKVKFTNNFIIRCQKYNIPDDFCILITSRNNAKVVDCYKSKFTSCFDYNK